MYVNNSICINKVFRSKPIYFTSFSSFSIFKCIKNVYWAKINRRVIIDILGNIKKSVSLVPFIGL